MAVEWNVYLIFMYETLLFSYLWCAQLVVWHNVLIQGRKNELEIFLFNRSENLYNHSHFPH